MPKLYLVSLLSLIFCLPAQAAADNALFSLLAERLQLMPQVAAYKANNHLPVEDLAREQEVITSSTRSATLEKLDEVTVKAFFEAQITLAKAIQYRVRAQLLLEPDAIVAADLINDIRPRLLQLGQQINKQLYLLLENNQLRDKDYNNFASTVAIPYITEQEKRYLFNRLMAVKLSTNSN